MTKKRDSVAWRGLQNFEQFREETQASFNLEG